MLKNHYSNLFLLRLFLHSIVSNAYSPPFQGKPFFNQSALLNDVRVKFLSESSCSNQLRNFWIWCAENRYCAEISSCISLLNLIHFLFNDSFRFIMIENFPTKDKSYYI